MSMTGRYLRIRGTHLNVDTLDGTEEETTIQFPPQGGNTGSEIWLLVSVHFVRTGGSATTFTFRLGQSAGWTNDDINERVTYATQTIATDPTINDVFASPVPCLTDSNGRLYFRPGYNTGTDDNDSEYEFWFQRAKGSG